VTATTASSIAIGRGGQGGFGILGADGAPGVDGQAGGSSGGSSSSGGWSSGGNGGSYTPASYSDMVKQVQQPNKVAQSSIGVPLTQNQKTYGLQQGYGPINASYADQLYQQDPIRKLTKPQTVTEMFNPLGSSYLSGAFSSIK
jgi:hypothetical protein